MPKYISHKKAVEMRESGWLKDRPILPGDLVVYPTSEFACRVGGARPDALPRFRAEVVRADREPVPSDALYDRIKEMWDSMWVFVEERHAEWVPGSSHLYEYDLGEMTNERGQTYRLTLGFRFLRAINPHHLRFQVFTEDDGHLYQRDWYSDWPYHWRVRAKSGATETLRVFDWTIVADDVAERVLPLITLSEYLRIEAARKAGKGFEWGGPTRIAPELAGPLHRRWKWDDIFVDADGAVYYVLDGKYTTALDAIVLPNKNLPMINELWAMVRGEGEVFTRLQDEYQAWAAAQDEAGEETDDPFRGFASMVRLGEYNGYALYLHFQCSPLGCDTLRFVYVDDFGNYEAYWDWSDNITAFSDEFGQQKGLRWRQHQLKGKRRDLDQSRFPDYDYNSGPWEGSFNPVIGTNDVEGMYQLCGADGSLFWVTESDLYTHYRAVLTKQEYNALLSWKKTASGMYEAARYAKGTDLQLCVYRIERSGSGRWRLTRRSPRGAKETTLVDGVRFAEAKQAAVSNMLSSSPYDWRGGG